MQLPLTRWIRISLFNLALVAALGVILRYKIAFFLPFIDQKHLQHGHSHFAFTGWVTQTLMVLLVASLASTSGPGTFKRYRWMLTGNLFTAYGMLVAFPIQGYGAFSISLSCLSVFISYAFAIMYWRDLNRQQKQDTAHLWFKVALLFHAISSLGVFALATMMATKTIQQNWYLAAEYFYLHFAYNGWFFFACMGLFTRRIAGSLNKEKQLNRVFWLFGAAFIPAYFLSVLWMNFPIWIYVIIVAAALIQVAGWGWLVQLLRTRSRVVTPFLPTARWLFILAGIALTIKLLLQLGSVIPSLSDISYGFRPIIIGYLHLVLLGVITLFLLGHILAEKYIILSKTAIRGVIMFTSGIILNEILLMAHGVASMNYNILPFINELLFIAALVMFAGLVLIIASQRSEFKK